MIPYEDYRKLKPKQSGSQIVAGSSHPLKSPAPKSYNRAANIYERREQESLNNSRPVQPKPPSTATRQHGSADAAERWSKGANSKKPASKLGGMSADAAERWSKGVSSKPQLAIASSKKAPETKSVPLSFNKATQIQRQGERNFTNSSSLHPVTKPEIPPKPIPGSASDLTAARKALQETLKAAREFEAKPGIPKQGRLGEMEQKDIRQEVGGAKARLEASTKAKALQDFKADPSIPKNGRVRDMEIKDLQREVSSANARYMGSQGRDRQGQPIKLTPVETQKPEPEKSWWDKGKNFLGGYVNFQKDIYIGAGEAVWDMGKGLVSLGKFVYDVKYHPDPVVRSQTAQKGGATVLALASNPAVQSLVSPGLAAWNFSNRRQETAQASRELGRALAKPYVDDWKNGHPGQAVGRAGVDFGSMFIPGGGVVGKVGTGANAVSKVGRVSKTLDEATTVGSRVTAVERATTVGGRVPAVKKAAAKTTTAASRPPAQIKFVKPTPVTEPRYRDSAIRPSDVRQGSTPSSVLSPTRRGESTSLRNSTNSSRHTPVTEPKHKNPVIKPSGADTTVSSLPDQAIVSYFDESVKEKHLSSEFKTLGNPQGNSKAWFMSQKDSEKIRNPNDAAWYTGMASSVVESIKGGASEIYGIRVPTHSLEGQITFPSAGDAKGSVHWREGGHTAVALRSPDGSVLYGSHFINSVREFVVPGATPVPEGSVLFKLKPASEGSQAHITEDIAVWTNDNWEDINLK